MIEIKIKILERLAAEGKVGCRLDLQIESVRPADEEVHLAAMVLSRLRDLGNEISQQEGANVKIVEIQPETGEN